MKIAGFCAVLVTGILLLFAVGDFPEWGSPSSPASIHVSSHYITHTIEETSVPNMVTSILADYRGFDTMFETTVIFSAGIAVLIILRLMGTGGKDEVALIKKDEVSYQDIIVQTASRIMVPFMQLFALYVIAHGHHSPGGGFQGGVILGASFILLAISYDLKSILKRMSEKCNILLGNIGVLIYSGIGVLCLILGANFLDYGVLARIMPATNSIEARSLGIFGVEVGVAIAVMAIVISIYVNIASAGSHRKGL